MVSVHDDFVLIFTTANDYVIGNKFSGQNKPILIGRQEIRIAWLLDGNGWIAK